MIMFYQLTRSSAEETLAIILPRALAAGWRVMLRGTDMAALKRLDARLWHGPEDGFLPHGLAGGAHDAAQPILLGTGAIANAAEGLVLLDNAQTTPAEAAPLQRVWVLFDGSNAADLAGARTLWTQLTTAGLAAQYWAEDTGRWEKKSEKPAVVVAVKD